MCHEWGWVGAWGVILGAARCKRCWCVATDKTVNGTCMGDVSGGGDSRGASGPVQAAITVRAKDRRVVPRCDRCHKCGSDLAVAPDNHQAPAPHAYMTRYDQSTTGAPYEVCGMCKRSRYVPA